MRGLQADALGYPFSTDPAYKAGQDPAGDIADGLGLRARKGPSLDYYGTAAAPIELSTTGSGDAIYGDTLDVTDATWLHVEFSFFMPALGDAMNVAVGLETSSDGVYWYPLPVINRASPITPSTMIRPDDGLVGALTPSTTGGYALDPPTTQNAPMLEDMLAFLATPASLPGDIQVMQRAIPFNVASALYVRVVFVAIYAEPPDVEVPSVYIRVNKAVSP